MTHDDFKPSYVWPNPAFPFRVYLDDPRCRIFIIENIQHNWVWFKQWHGQFRETDFFFVYCGWYHGEAFAREAEKIFDILGLPRDRFFFLFNSPGEQAIFERHGFRGDLVAQNAWLDENVVMRPLDVPKQYRAIYVGRRSAFKRHMLAAKVSNLALVAGINHGNAVSPVPDHVYLNDKQLTPDEVCVKINEARCGLLLSETEGACFASSEYLLCGVPVVSTTCFGGRDVWYNDYNAIVCSPDPDEIAAAVENFCANPRDPARIRAMHIEQSQGYRARFTAILGQVLRRFGVDDIDAEAYFKANFFHKLRKSYRPDFEAIWGDRAA